MTQNFNNPLVHTQSWYVACKSSEIKLDKATTFNLLGRKITFYRTNSGIHALDARCPHLGADLGKGEVVGENIRCPFHHWEFEHNGNCSYAPGHSTVPKRHVLTYPVQEKWGYVWLWNGPKILFELPKISSALHVLRMPPQTIRCHPHVMIANGLDISHFSTLHGMTQTKSELRDKPPYSIEVKLSGKPASKWMEFLTGTTQKEIEVSFQTLGGHIAIATISSPVRFVMMFTGNITPSGSCNTHTIAFLPKRMCPDFFRALVSMYILLHDDRRVLDGIEFSPSFVPTDKPLMKFVEVVNRMDRF